MEKKPWYEVNAPNPWWHSLPFLRIKYLKKFSKGKDNEHDDRPRQY